MVLARVEEAPDRDREEADQHRGREQPGGGALARQLAAEREGGGLVALRLGVRDRVDALDREDHVAGIAAADRHAVPAEAELGALGAVDLGAHRAAPVDLEAEVAGSGDEDAAAVARLDAGVAGIDAEIGECDLVLGGAAEADRVAVDAGVAHDLAVIGGEADMADQERHAVTSRRTR